MKKPEIETTFGCFYKGWNLANLPDYVFFQEGPGLRTSQFTDSGMKVINVKNILLDGTIDISNSDRHISLEEFEKKYQHFAIETDDIVVSSSGWSYGKVGRIQQSDLPLMMNTSVIRFHPLWKELLDADYLYNFLRSSFFTNQVESFIIGCQQPNFGPAHIKRMLIPLPPLPTQQKIASILTAYDDLIENNTRRIKILEEMARSHYHEWFVKFRFPGYEQVQMVDSELGLIPEGWEVRTLSDVCNIIMGQSPKSEFYNESGEGLPFHQGVTNFGNRFPIDKKYCTVFNRVAERGDILFSVRAPVGRINLANKKIVIGRGLSAIRSKSGKQEFIFEQLKEKFQEEDSIGGGTIFKSVTKEDMYGIKIIYPDSTLVSKFELFVKPFFRNVEILTVKNTNLRKTRDLLLPKLISGEIDVEKLEIETEKIAA
ncbi:MAG: restriction endonuclease subunit S [Rivularia sp. (in: cyanobacteria)]